MSKHPSFSFFLKQEGKGKQKIGERLKTQKRENSANYPRKDTKQRGIKSTSTTTEQGVFSSRWERDLNMIKPNRKFSFAKYNRRTGVFLPGWHGLNTLKRGKRN